jgi:hypothetical protein
MNDFGYSQFVHVYTRISNSGKGHILDLIISNAHDVISDTYKLNPFYTSDHNVIQFQVTNFHTAIIQEICEDDLFFDFEHYEMMKRFLAAVNWKYEFSFAYCTVDYWNIFAHGLHRATESHLPDKEISSVRQKNIQICRGFFLVN